MFTHSIFEMDEWIYSVYTCVFLYLCEGKAESDASQTALCTMQIQGGFHDVPDQFWTPFMRPSAKISEIIKLLPNSNAQCLEVILIFPSVKSKAFIH